MKHAAQTLMYCHVGPLVDATDRQRDEYLSEWGSVKQQVMLVVLRLNDTVAREVRNPIIHTLEGR